MKSIFILIALNISLIGYSQTYEEVRISDETRQKLRETENGIDIYGGFNMPFGGAKRAFSYGYNIGLSYVHQLERVWIKANFNYTNNSARSIVEEYSIKYGFGNLNQMQYNFGFYFKIPLADNFSMFPGLELGNGISWHKREVLDYGGFDPFFVSNRGVSMIFPLNVNLKIAYKISDKLGFFVEPEAGLLFTYWLYSGSFDTSIYELFDTKDETISYTFNINAGVTLFLNRSKKKKR